MSQTLVTFPGKLGDLLWALPTIREIACEAGEPVDLVLGNRCAGMVELLRCQPYLRSVVAHPAWATEDTAPMTPRVPPGVNWHYAVIGGSEPYSRVYHLGYESWPKTELPIEILHNARRQGFVRLIFFDKPWIFLPPIHQPATGEIYLGWTDEWFELKLGVSSCLSRGLVDESMVLRTPESSRWLTEGLEVDGLYIAPASWLETAQVLASCKLYVGCLSAQWVLANALGVPCVVVEPNPHRHNPIFWWDGPMESDGKPRNRMVMGNDGKPTFDARAVVQAVKEELERERG